MELIKEVKKLKLNKKAESKPHPDHAPEIARVRRVKGQVEGIEKMIGDRRYCPDIIMQIRAAKAALTSLEASILKTHLRHCVKDAMRSKDLMTADEKIQEIVQMLSK